jgi:hypothetical protein
MSCLFYFVHHNLNRVTLKNGINNGTLRYGIIAWGSANERDIQKILIQQKKAIRIVEQLGPQEHCKPYFISNNILTVISLYLYEVIVLIKSNPPQLRTDCHNHNLRNKTNFNLNHHRLTKTSKTPSFMGVKMYNLLPKNLKEINQLNKFKKQLKLYLIQRPYYKLNEFVDEHTFNN